MLNDLHCRALRALGLEAQPMPAGLCYIEGREIKGPVEDALLVGMLMEELAIMPEMCHTVNIGHRIPACSIIRWEGYHKIESDSILEALVLAVEAAKGEK